MARALGGEEVRGLGHVARLAGAAVDREAGLIGALSAEERAGLTASLAKLERSLT